MVANMGKKFEENFKLAVQQAKEGQIFIYRIKDTDTSYNHTDTSRYTHDNLCDYFMFYDGILYALELKSTCYKSIGFEQEAYANQDDNNYVENRHLVTGWVKRVFSSVQFI
jgi:penicillin-binding protein-related factor A (putative recombinase)